MKDYESLKAEIENTYDRLYDLQEDIRGMEDELKEICPHPENEISIHRGYDPGIGMSDDRARQGFWETKTCQICNKQLAYRAEERSMGEWQKY